MNQKFEKQQLDTAIRGEDLQNFNKYRLLADPNQPHDGYYPLLTAAEFGRINMLLDLLSIEGIRVNIQGSKQPPALISLCSNKIDVDMQAVYLEAINKLLGRNADVNAVFIAENGTETTALAAAIQNDLTDIIQRLLLCKRLEQKPLALALDTAISKGNLGLVKTLIENGAKPTSSQVEAASANEATGIAAYLQTLLPKVSAVVFNSSAPASTVSTTASHSVSSAHVPSSVSTPALPDVNEYKGTPDETLVLSSNNAIPFNTPAKQQLLCMIDKLLSKSIVERMFPWKFRKLKKTTLTELKSQIINKASDNDSLENAAKMVIMLSLQRTFFGLSNTTRTGLILKKLINTKAYSDLKHMIFKDSTSANNTLPEKHIRYRDFRKAITGTNHAKDFSSGKKKDMFQFFSKIEKDFINEDERQKYFKPTARRA